MKLLTSTKDDKILAENHLIEMNIEEYSSMAKSIIRNNDFQRKRVLSANRTYTLLKDDIKTGCVIPPIVLAFFPNMKNENEKVTSQNIMSKLESHSKDLLILDGLQRTYTILDLLEELSDNKELLMKVNSMPLRIELYSGISKVGVLYRMLTLNTGQTPMSTRHQVEMLYSDYKIGVDNLKFISETDNRPVTGENEYKFNDVLDCFLSYITGDFLPLDREDLIGIIKNLEAVTKDDKQKDVFKVLIKTYNSLRIKLRNLSKDWLITDDSAFVKRPFARNINELFSKVQVLAGFGAAISFLVENKLIREIEDVQRLQEELILSEQQSLNLLIKDLDEIQLIAKKIGNEQRMYFYYFIRSMFNKDNDGYLNIDKSVREARRFYNSNTLR